MNAPASVSPGETITYTVTVINVMDAAVALDPCPQVRQSFGPSAGTWQLNCSPGRLPGHTQTVFEARITSPPESGTYRLRWVLVFADGRVGIGDLATDGVDVRVTN
jgi:hypothetical protein